MLAEIDPLTLLKKMIGRIYRELIRVLMEKDAQLMYEWMHDEEVIQGLQADNFRTKTLDDCEKFIRSSWDMKDDCHMAIVDDGDEYMGTVSLKNIDECFQDAEFAIVLRKSAWRKGYASQAIIDILSLAFEKYKLRRVYCNVLRSNTVAIKLYEKMGWTRLQQIDARYIQNGPRNNDGSLMDVLFYLFSNKHL